MKRLTIFALLATSPAIAQAASGNDAWEAFKACLTARETSSLEAAMKCLPADCDWIYTTSASLQASCNLEVTGPACDRPARSPALVLPRLILSCSDGTFVPTYSFCLKPDAIEVAVYQNRDEIRLHDIRYENARAVATAIPRSDTVRNCASCHFYYDPDDVNPFAHKAIPLDPARIVGRGRMSEAIRSTCAAVEAAMDGRCSIRGRIGRASFPLDGDMISARCRAVLSAENSHD